MDKKLRKMVKKQRKRDLKYRKESSVGHGATVGENKGVAGWRHKNWWREENSSEKLQTCKRRTRWELKQAYPSSKPAIRRRPNAEH